MSCICCGRGFTGECECPESEIEIEFLSTGGNQRRPDNTVGISAGRKRAAADYEVDKTKPCEWRFTKNAGGGLYPIIGCLNGFQVHRHHGPVKNTTRNERSNIHIICATCHNTWHAKNDAYYDETVYNELPHNPEPATLNEVLEGNPKKVSS